MSHGKLLQAYELRSSILCTYIIIIPSDECHEIKFEFITIIYYEHDFFNWSEIEHKEKQLFKSLFSLQVYFDNEVSCLFRRKLFNLCLI